MVKNQAGQIIGAEMISAANGSAFTGVVTVYVDVDASGQALGSVGAGVCSAQGNGYFTYGPSALETNGNLLAFTFIGAGAIPVTVQIATVTPSQQSALSTATGALSTPVATIVADAFRELAVFAPNLAIPPDDFAFGLGKLNRLFDNMTDDRRLAFSQGFASYVLTPLLQPHTLGPNAATFTVTTRPIAIRAAQLVLTDVTPNVYLPVRIRDWEWWSNVSVRGISTSIPTNLYYQPDWPNGSLYLWPVPTVAYQLELVTSTVFGQVAAADTFWLPPGYRDYVTLRLAKSLISAYPGTPIPPLLVSDLSEIENRLFNSNLIAPRLQTRGSGVPTGPRGADFNYRSRTFQ